MVCVKMVNLGESREFTRETHGKRDECQSLAAPFACHNWKACSQTQGAMSRRVSSSFYNANDASLFPVEQGWRIGSSNPGVDTICGLSLLLVLSFALRGFSPGTPVFPSP